MILNQTHFEPSNRFLAGSFVCILIAILGCDNKQKHQQAVISHTIDYIRRLPGTNDTLAIEAINAGKVLIGYSDCYNCHKEDKRSVGPSFRAIATRYPIQKVYIDLLAHKIIIGGSGSWGYPVMDPHPLLTFEEAKKMVCYILSFKEN